ncbi:MAG: tetratricopeptide repeat protein, partial [Gemmatimonadetes bacterium]|nr:tetratricopeptide repeat protein [Gemmatimonadota bacterium]
GMLYEERDAFEDAAVEYEAALAIDSENAFVQKRYGRALGRLGRSAEAEEALARAIDLDPGDGGVRNDLALLLLQRGAVAEAHAQLMEANRLEPGLAAAHRNLARVLRSTGDEEGAAREEAIVKQLEGGER